MFTRYGGGNNFVPFSNVNSTSTTPIDEPVTLLSRANTEAAPLDLSHLYDSTPAKTEPLQSSFTNYNKAINSNILKPNFSNIINKPTTPVATITAPTPNKLMTQDEFNNWYGQNSPAMQKGKEGLFSSLGSLFDSNFQKQNSDFETQAKTLQDQINEANAKSDNAGTVQQEEAKKNIFQKLNDKLLSATPGYIDKYGRNISSNDVSVGNNGIVNGAIDTTGMAISMLANPGNIYGSISPAGGFIENKLANGLVKANAPKLATSLIPSMARTGTEMSLLNSMGTAEQGGTNQDIASSALQGGLQGLAFGGLTKGLGIALPKLKDSAFKTTTTTDTMPGYNADGTLNNLQNPKGLNFTQTNGADTKPIIQNSLDTFKNINTPTEAKTYLGTLGNKEVATDSTNPLKPLSNTNMPTADNTLKSPLNVASKIETPSSVPSSVSASGSLDNLIKTEPNKYVDTSPIDINISKNDKSTATDIRQSYTGKLNSQIVSGNQLRDTIQKLAPNEQEGIQLYIDAGGDKAHLQEMANNPDTQLDKYIPNTKTTYREAYNQALNLSPNAMKATDMAKQYYNESGNYALDLGTTRSKIEDYANRIWNKDQGNTARLGNSGLGTYTGHSQERVYDNIGEGILNGKEPSTLNAGDLLAVHNQEMARVNSNMELANSMKSNGIGQTIKGDAPIGFTSIDSLSKKIPTKDGTLTQKYVVPDGIAKGLQAITDPNYLKQWGRLDKLQKYQGVVKTVDLSYSLFHHITLATQMLYNNTGGLDMVRHLGDLAKLNTPEFNTMEQDFAKHTGMTTKVADNLDTLNKISGNTSIVDKMTNIPVLKQLKQFSDANTNLLFNKVQRWLKVTDYNNKVLDYVAKNPQTDNLALTQVKRSIATEVNNAYGGLNWEALGRNKTTLSAERLALLAPDWTESSVRMATRATGLGKIDTSQNVLQNIGNVVKGDAGVNAARKQYLVGLGGGLLLTEGLNHILTGHFTDKNPKGHELEVEVQPGVYVSAFKSGIGDMTKLGSNMVTSGVGGGIVRSLQAKFSPLLRTGVGLASNKDYNGAMIYGNAKDSNLQNDVNIGKFLASSAGPMPFGVGNITKYSQDPNANPLGGGLVGTGIAKYAQDKTNPNNPTASYKDNWIHKNLFPDANQKIINDINIFKSANLKNSTQANADMQTAVNNGTDTHVVANKYGLSYAEEAAMAKNAQDSLTKYDETPLQQAFGSLSKENQQTYLQKHPEYYNALNAFIK